MSTLTPTSARPSSPSQKPASDSPQGENSSRNHSTANQSADGNISLRISRVIKTTRQRAFDAWTKPELMKKWFAPGDMSVAAAKSDLRVGGSYEVSMAGQTGAGETACGNSTATGTYQKIVPNELLVFTWGFPGDMSAPTMVTVEFKEADGGTELVITHERFASTEIRNKHQHGWLGCVDKLEREFAN
jgi:uncharacterized protein YndB with AHSA1/START domain